MKTRINIYENIDEVIDSNDVVVGVETVANILDTSPQTLRESVRNNPDMLGGCAIFLGSRIVFARIPLLGFLGVTV